MKSETIPSVKKVWQKPNFVILDTNSVNGGNSAQYKEGAPVGGGNYRVLYNDGRPFGIYPKMIGIIITPKP